MMAAVTKAPVKKVIEKKEKPAKKDLKPVKLPKSLAACADRYYLVMHERLDKQKQLTKELEDLVREEKALAEHLINTLPKGEASGIAGQVARASIETKPVPTIQDKAKFLAYVRKTGELDLLSQSLNTEAVKARWDAKKAIPGVGVFNVVRVSIHKL
jgi:arginine repressor